MLSVRQIHCVGSFAYAIKKNYPLDKLTTRTLNTISKPYKKNEVEIDPNDATYQTFRYVSYIITSSFPDLTYIVLQFSLEFCGKAAGLAELFDSIAGTIDTSSISDIEVEEEIIPKRTVRKQTKRDVSSDEDSGSDDEEDVTQRRPNFGSAPSAPTREKISRSSKTLAEGKMFKMADENVVNICDVEMMDVA